MPVAACLLSSAVASLLPLCNVLTPNQFEAELLTGLPVTSEQQALQAAQALHKTGPHTVVRNPGLVVGVEGVSMRQGA